MLKRTHLPSYWMVLPGLLICACGDDSATNASHDANHQSDASSRDAPADLPRDSGPRDQSTIDQSAADQSAADQSAADQSAADQSAADQSAADQSGDDQGQPDASLPDANLTPPKLVKAFPNLTFSRPLDVTHAGDGTDRVFVAEQGGIVWAFANKVAATKPTAPFLDISQGSGNPKLLNVAPTGGDEFGLLGIAFHPKYSSNGYFFVNYTIKDGLGGWVAKVARFTVNSGNANAIDPTSMKDILSVAQVDEADNGGGLAFGPDAYLYVGRGDGGGDKDSAKNGQNKQTLLGAMLRIDVDTAAGVPYAIPADNPYVGNASGYAEEIWAHGFRNPWRYSFDPVTGWLWLGDVGYDEAEEINIVTKGKNYGWNTMEGSYCFDPQVNCNKTGLTNPIYEYDHSVGTVIIAGHVYRGAQNPALLGAFVYADGDEGKFWTLNYDGVNPPTPKLLLQNKTVFPVAFGLDQHNELLICGFAGHIYRFTQN